MPRKRPKQGKSGHRKPHSPKRSPDPSRSEDNHSADSVIASLLPKSVFPSDGKLYYRIGEVSKITGVKAYVLRYWESEFRWMSPHKSRSKQRLYRRKDIEMILLIRRLLHEERYTIAGARKRLRELGVAGVQDEAVEAAGDGAGSREGSADLRECFSQIRNELHAIREML